VTGEWREIGDRIWIRRWAFLDQTIGAVAGHARVAVIDTRSTIRQGRELLAEVRQITPLPHVVVNTHHHWDHTLGNAAFRPCEAWGHERCAAALRAGGRDQVARALARAPEFADDLVETTVDPPEWTFASGVDLDLGGRTLLLRHLGRGHTDNDVVIAVPSAGVVFAGDLVEEGAPPSFGDAFPLEWPATLANMLDLADEGAAFVPGHGEPIDAESVLAQLAEIAFVAETARRAGMEAGGAGTGAFEGGAAGGASAAAREHAADVARHLGWPAGIAEEALRRAFGQVGGEIS
jgi:glyoxylase-like metal-dependent hydrolase (beta-lactamase superfamily II)